MCETRKGTRGAIPRDVDDDDNDDDDDGDDDDIIIP
jgi:hypothetical protein